MGNSEVGHLNLGAGRVVMQDLVRVSESIRDGSFFRIDAFTSAWWVVLFPGVAMVVTIVAFNALGDALRDVLDPRQVHLDRSISNAAIEIESVSRPAPPASSPPPSTTHQLAQNG